MTSRSQPTSPGRLCNVFAPFPPHRAQTGSVPRQQTARRPPRARADLDRQPRPARAAGRDQDARGRVQPPRRARSRADRARLAEAMARIERAADRALEMIDEVLTIEQLSESPAANMPVLETVDVEETIGEAIFLNRDLLKQARCGVVVTRAEGEGRMRGAWNRSCLLRLFSNLLQNVSKHAPESPILIHLERHGDSLRLRFADRGPGLPVGTRLDDEPRPSTAGQAGGGASGWGCGSSAARSHSYWAACGCRPPPAWASCSTSSCRCRARSKRAARPTGGRAAPRSGSARRSSARRACG